RVGNGPVPAGVRGIPVELIRVVVRGRSHREDLAVGGIHDDDAAGLRAADAERFGELVLGGELHARVEGEDERRPLLRGPARLVVFAVAAAPGVGEGDELAWLAADGPVVEVLEAREARAVGAHEAEDGRSEMALGIEALRLG